MAPVTTRNSIIAALAVVAAAAITATGVVLAARGGDAPKTSTNQSASSSGSNVNAGTGVCGVNVGTGAKVDCRQMKPEPVPTDVPDQEVADRIVNKDVRPSGTGPWPFLVLFDDNIGLYVRDGTGQNAHRVGALPHAQVMYVACKTTRGWNPDPARRVGPLWYKVHWPTSKPDASPPPGASAPEFPAQYWAFGGYLVPDGHNGEIPTCD